MKAKKYLGQNFLNNLHTLEKIVNAGNIAKNELIVEVGPGKGILTEYLLKKAEKVISIEKDAELIPFLKDKFKDSKNLELIEADILKTNPPTQNYKVIANIPYYITSPILNHFLQTENKPKSMTLLVQKEVAEKICAKEGDHSILSIQVQLFGLPKIISNVPASHFSPAPKVDSAILHIEIFEKEKYKNPQQILKIAKMAFSQKRKKLKNTLKALNLSTNLDLNRRPQTLSIKEWEELSNHN